MAFAFGKTRLHVYRGDAVPVSNVGLNKAPDQASNKDEEADQPSSSKGSEHPTSDSELDFSQMSIYSERELLSEGEDIDSTLTNEGAAKSDNGATNQPRPLLQLYCLNLPRDGADGVLD